MSRCALAHALASTLAVAALAAPATASAAEVSPGLRAWLAAPCGGPSAAALAAMGPQAVDALRAVVADRRERRYARHRAVGFLSRLGGPRALATLLALRSDPDVEVRRSVTVALATGLGVRHPDAARAALAPLTRDPNASVRALARRLRQRLPAAQAARRGLTPRAQTRSAAP
jgi:HEAT repeat protein